MKGKLALTCLLLSAFAVPHAWAQCCKQASKDKPGASVAKAKQCCNQDQAATKDTATCSKPAKACCSSERTASAKVCCSSDKCKTAAKCCPAATCVDRNCAGDLVRYKGMPLPQLGYQVNDKTFTCPAMAGKSAKAAKTDLKYVVADNTYAEKPKALKAYAAVLDRFADEMLTVKYAVGDKSTMCPNNAEAMARSEGQKVRYRLASFDFADHAAAEKAAHHAREEAGKISLTTSVDGKTYTCPARAAAAADDCGEKVQYCVGETKTHCAMTAEIHLALERIKTAVDVCERESVACASR